VGGRGRPRPGAGRVRDRTGGVSGNLQFRDLTQSVPVDIAGHVDQPMAVGGLLALEVEEGTPGQDADLVAASSSDPGVFVVESFSLGRAMVRGVGPEGLPRRDHAGV